MEDELVRAACARKGSPYLTPEQAAFYLGVSTRTLRRGREKGDGPAFRRHSQYLHYHIDDLDAWSKARGGYGDA